MTKASDNPYPSALFEEQASAPTTPSSGFWRAYFKSDGLYIVDDAGSETGPLSTGGPGGSSGPFPLGMPYGTLDRSYTFASTIESWTAESGGSLSATGGKLRLTRASSGARVAVEPSGATNIADGELQMDVTIISGQDVDLVFRATDASNCYLLEFIDKASTGNGVRLYKRVAGTFTQIGQSYTALPLENDGQSYKLMVRFKGSQIDAYVNNTLVGTWWDTTYTTGDVGVAAGGGASGGTIDVDNVQVYSITTETQASPGTGARV